MKAEIREKAASLGFVACGFAGAANPEHALEFERWLAAGQHGEMAWLARNAAKRTDPQKVLPGARTVIVLAVSYDAGPELGESGGVVARYARGADYHDVLAGPLRELSEWIDTRAGLARRSLWYVDTGPILEREFAERAGVGFVGKHTGLISRSWGNWILLAEILTTLEVEPDQPEKNRCGSCSRCITACPTEAIRAPFELDARRCISYLTIELKGSIPMEFRRSMGNRVFGCDDCLAACPWNRFAREGGLMRAHLSRDRGRLDLRGLLSLDEMGFKARFAGTPMLRTKRRGLVRNACVALGNTGNVEDLPALEKAAREEEPLIAEHAAWAMAEIRARCG